MRASGCPAHAAVIDETIDTGVSASVDARPPHQSMLFSSCCDVCPLKPSAVTRQPLIRDTSPSGRRSRGFVQLCKFLFDKSCD
ncbi:MAG: hypothetical protein MZV63_11555 [Marinilabiliales bacterium]|nr:hypothetical protein [Marinilabiliales bacterium]